MISEIGPCCFAEKTADGEPKQILFKFMMVSPSLPYEYVLAFEFANLLEEELKFPGEIRVQVIRETRVIEYAR